MESPLDFIYRQIGESFQYLNANFQEERIKAELQKQPELFSLLRKLTQPPAEEPQPEPQPEPVPALTPFTTQGNQILLNGKPFKFIGCNLLEAIGYNYTIQRWAGPGELKTQLDEAALNGFSVVRIAAAHHSLTAEQVIPMLQYVLDLIKERGLYAVVVLADNLGSGYYPPDVPEARAEGEYTEAWVKTFYKMNYRAYVKRIVEVFGNHPAILAWEPVSGLSLLTPLTIECEAALSFYADISSLIRAHSSKLISTGLRHTYDLFNHYAYNLNYMQRLYTLPNINLASLATAQDPANAKDEYGTERYQIEQELKITTIPFYFSSITSHWDDESADWYGALLSATLEKVSGYTQKSISFIYARDIGVHADGLFNAPRETSQARRWHHVIGFYRYWAKRFKDYVGSIAA